MGGKPIASFEGDTSVPSESLGYRLGGGGVPFITQLRKATRRALTTSVWETGFAGRVPVP